jgi:two-component system NtrC family sensor kinase
MTMQNSANQACGVTTQPPKQRKKLRQKFQNIGISAQSRWQQLHSLWEHRRHRRHLLTLLILGSIALISSSTACMSYFVVRGLILDNLKQIALLKLEKGTDEIDNWLSSRKAEIETIAYSSTIRTLDWTSIEPILQEETYLALIHI